MLAHPLTLVALAATALAASPAPPKLTYLYSANLTFGATISIGSVPEGIRNLQPVAGGTFSGPKLSGTVTPQLHSSDPLDFADPLDCDGSISPKPQSSTNHVNVHNTTGKVGTGMDWGLTSAKGVFSPDALYTLHTDDNATVLVTEKGHAPGVQVLFETASDKYAWLNSAVAYGSGTPTANGIALDVWQVSRGLLPLMYQLLPSDSACANHVVVGVVRDAADLSDRLGLEVEPGKMQVWGGVVNGQRAEVHHHGDEAVLGFQEVRERNRYRLLVRR